MTEVIQWPMLDRLTFTSFFIQRTSRAAGANLLGVSQTVGTGSGVWRISLSIGTYVDPAAIKAFEALIADMRGQENIAALPIPDCFAYDADVAPRVVGFSDGTLFTDGTGFIDHSSAASMVVTSGALAGENQLTVSLTNPIIPPLRVGDHFAHNHFLYKVVRSQPNGTIRFEPEARSDIPVSAVLVTDPPVVYLRLASDDEGLRGRGHMSRGEPITVNFVEAFDREP